MNSNMNNVTDLNYCKSGKKQYTTLHCDLCNHDREIYKPDLKRLKNGCNKCTQNVFNEVVDNLSFLPEESYIYYYSRYRAFIRRCYERNQKQYIDYGARGITVNKEWKGNNKYNLDTDCQAFKSWLIWAFSFGEIKNLSLERIDNNKEYSSLNCEMIPFELQAINKRNSKNNLSKKSSIYSGVCLNKYYYMVFFWDKKLNKSITISNKNTLLDEEEAALLYDSYLIENDLPIVNKPLIKIVDIFKYLFEEQDKLNTFINKNWKIEGLSFDLYTQVESIEGIQSFNFKHWKKDKNDFKNAEMEFIDIVFFTISQCLKYNIDYKQFAYLFNNGYVNNANKILDSDNIVKLFQDICFYSLTNNLNNQIICLGYLANSLNYSADKLYEMYIGKNVLNIFRQDHGYKEGTYIKQWPSPLDHGTIEDNVYLEMIMNESSTKLLVSQKPDKLFDFVYNRLEQNYPDS